MFLGGYAAVPNIAQNANTELLSGYSLNSKNLTEPARSKIAADPIWIANYHTLIIHYRASGHFDPGFAVLALRSGSVGPITPGANATNPENPLASGSDVITVTGKDLVLDGSPYTFRVDLKDKLKVPQIDMLRFALPEGATLNIAKLQLLADSDTLPCALFRQL